MSRTYLAVPFADKDRAKAAGARWDGARRAWYVEGGRDLAPFRAWLVRQAQAFNLRAPGYFLAHSADRCWRCKHLTLVMGFLLPRGVEELQHDPLSPDDDWQGLPLVVFAHTITQLDQRVALTAKSLGARLSLQESKQAGMSYLMNMCEHCNAQLGDNFLFGQPDGAFHPTTPQGASLVRLKWQREEFKATCSWASTSLLDSMVVLD